MFVASFAVKLICRQYDCEDGSCTGKSCGLDNSFMIFHDLFTNRKADASAVIFISSMQPLEKFKYFITVFLLEADAVVSNTYVTITGLR